MNKKTKKLKREFHLIAVFIIFITAAIIIFSFSSLAFSTEDITYRINRYGFPSLFIISLLLESVPQLISPVVILSLSIVAGMKPYFAIPIAILGSLIGSMISYHVGKKYMQVAVSSFVERDSAKKLIGLVNKYGKIIVPIAALSPLPYLSIVIGAMNFSRRNFILYGLIPRAFSFLIYGILAHILQTL